ncbi:uncharacterized protein Z520_08809 [Fonsecaea multimorphosa CBS 102226]|uniref:Uncharacterized protein n=1 Tax=Fonsecaea multimorphosa CBS 102226 TaxID=1442371 RepID=A0A0D2JPK5_9EURO|nr:uncharacterized protein Z520_08809 [Fonsecaea multimorphosa CBS 102226]KIX95292.1 hypothetical protein Z520_08809 [Fonsecaea multimorphosa CBS 102226]
MAITHDRNAKLKDRPLVDKFFRDIQGHRTLEDPKTCSWLANLPFDMCDDSIPLFVEGDESRDDSTPNPVIGIGRLFVHARNDTGGRTSKWTGYEVFVDRSLSLWIVFDIHSDNPPASDWYPVPSRLCSEDDQAPDMARFLPTLQDLAHATFEAARNTVKSTGMSGNMKAGLIAKEEVAGLFSSS